jgi:hypothetical protein
MLRNRNDNFYFIVAGVDVAVNNIKVFCFIIEMLRCAPFVLLLKIVSIQCYESGPS